MTGPANPHQSVTAPDRVSDAVGNALSAVLDLVLQAVSTAVRPHAVRLIQRLHWRAAGYALTVMASIWAAIAITLAAAQYLPLWASFLCVSGFLAVGAVGAFIIPVRRNGSREAGRSNNFEGEQGHGQGQDQNQDEIRKQ